MSRIDLTWWKIRKQIGRKIDAKLAAHGAMMAWGIIEDSMKHEDLKRHAVKFEHYSALHDWLYKW